MNTALRILARIAAVAIAILFVLPLLGVTVSGGIGTAVACAAGFEVACWILGSALAFGITSLGGKKENSKLLASLVFAGFWFFALLGLASAAPSLLTVSSSFSAVLATAVLLLISAVTTYRHS